MRESVKLQRTAEEARPDRPSRGILDVGCVRVRENVRQNIFLK